MALDATAEETRTDYERALSLREWGSAVSFGVYKVAVSYAGCHDNRMDKLWWNEQWMGWPIGAQYSRASNVDNAARLQGHLLSHLPTCRPADLPKL